MVFYSITLLTGHRHLVEAQEQWTSQAAYCLTLTFVNFVLDWDEVIHDGGEVPAHVSDRDAEGEDPLRQAGDVPNCGDWLAVAVF